MVSSTGKLTYNRNRIVPLGNNDSGNRKPIRATYPTIYDVETMTHCLRQVLLNYKLSTSYVSRYKIYTQIIIHVKTKIIITTYLLVPSHTRKKCQHCTHFSGVLRSKRNFVNVYNYKKTEKVFFFCYQSRLCSLRRLSHLHFHVVPFN